MEIKINKDNCSNLYFDDLGYISFTRVINNRIYNVSTNADDLLKVLSNLSKMSDDDFILIAQLQKSSVEAVE
jgi:hypothetical protein